MNEAPPTNIEVGILCVKHESVMEHLGSNLTNIFDFTKVC